MNVMLKLRIVGAFWNLDFCRINFHVWLSSINFAGIEFHNFAEKKKPGNFPPAKMCGIKVALSFKK